MLEALIYFLLSIGFIDSPEQRENLTIESRNDRVITVYLDEDGDGRNDEKIVIKKDDLPIVVMDDLD